MNKKEWVEAQRKAARKHLASVEKRLNVATMTGNPKDYSDSEVANLREIEACLIGQLYGLDVGGEQ